jgi:pilus assembly protein Flp/PilA
MLPYWILQVKRAFKKAGDFDETGQTLVEYALILAFVAVVVIAVLTLTGVNLSDSYEKIAGSIPNIGWFEKSISINNRSDSQGHIQWFIEGD